MFHIYASKYFSETMFR